LHGLAVRRTGIVKAIIFYSFGVVTFVVVYLFKGIFFLNLKVRFLWVDIFRLQERAFFLFGERVIDLFTRMLFV
jgi:hypothetical protein